MQRSTARPSPLRLGESSSLSQKSRQSLPAARPATEHGPAPSAVQPASPEVISSLISSLSVISTPAQSHFDNLPKIESRTAPSSPAVQQTEFVPAADAPQQPGAGFGMDYGAYKSPAAEEGEQDYLHPDAAAASPIVRMSKPPPSPRSPRSPMSRRSSRSLPEDKGPTRTGSRASLPSSVTAAEHDDTGGFGAISVEAPAPRRSSASVASTGSGSKRSVKSPFNLLKKPSRDFVKDKDRDHNGLGEGPPRLNSSRSGVSLRSNHSMADLAEEGAGDTDIAQTTFTGSPALNGGWKSPEDGSNFSPGGIGSGRTIPTRESSLRHTQKKASSNRRRSVRHSAYSSHDLTIEDEVPEVKAAEDGVSKRIGEIKNQQKKIRDELLQDDGASSTASKSGLPQTPTGRKQQQQQQQYSEPLSTPPQSAPSSRQVGRAEPALKEVDELRGDETEDSAPSPTVLTHKSPSNNKRAYSPLMSKSATVPSSPSLDRSDSANLKSAKRQSDQSRTADAKNGRRRLSGTASPSIGHGMPGADAPDERPGSADSIDNAVEAYLTAPRLTQRVAHPEGDRIIAFSEVGDPKGHVVFCCVGMGLTRYLTAFYDELARTLKLRLITPDRPGVGESEPRPDGAGTPLSWPDDLATICNHLKITKFSLLAHSAGAIYALATALRMPQHIRGRVHLLAPWIPPSQMSGLGSQKEPLPANALPYSQRILRALPTPFLRVANSSFMTATSSSITSSLPKNSRRTKRRSTVGAREAPPPPEKKGSNSAPAQIQPSPGKKKKRNSDVRISQTVVSRETSDPSNPNAESAIVAAAAKNNHDKTDQERNSDYDYRLTHSIWELATTNANPAVDLLICLERRQPIGFRYVDITRSVVIHHGSRDTRVPVDNARWLGGMMRRCEVRVLDGEGHGLMASATVMGNVLMEIAKEWDDWTTLVQGRGRRANTTVTQR